MSVFNLAPRYPGSAWQQSPSSFLSFQNSSSVVAFENVTPRPDELGPANVSSSAMPSPLSVAAYLQKGFIRRVQVPERRILTAQVWNKVVRYETHAANP